MEWHDFMLWPLAQNTLLIVRYQKQTANISHYPLFCTDQNKYGATSNWFEILVRSDVLILYCCCCCFFFLVYFVCHPIQLSITQMLTLLPQMQLTFTQYSECCSHSRAHFNGYILHSTARIIVYDKQQWQMHERSKFN